MENVSERRLHWTDWAALVQRFIEQTSLVLIFFLVIVPFGVVIRILGIDLLRLRKRSESYWRVRDETEKQDMKFQF
jgi:hypothetical protein